jgi:hypothetical protein
MTERVLSINVDRSEFELLKAEFARLAHGLDAAEIERRIGRPFGDRFTSDCVDVVWTGRGLRVRPTAEFERAIMALWQRRS